MRPHSQHDFVSVVMPVHNALPFLDDAIRSILGQSFTNFEFVIYDDSSDDGSTERLREWAERDTRIRLIEGTHRLGPAGSSNSVVREARAPLIARMDADDISHPDRLARQVRLMNERQDVGLVGTLCDRIDASGRTLTGPDLWRLTTKSSLAPFPHGSIMFRREVFDRVGGYRPACEFWEDQDFILRMSAQCRIFVMAEPLYHYRHSYVSTRLASDRERVERAVDLMYRSIDRLESGASYEDLLARSTQAQAGGRIDPRVFVSLVSLILWAGGKPRMLRRLLRRARLSANVVSLATIAWTAAASGCPALLRRGMRSVAGLRSRSFLRRKFEAGGVEWIPARQLASVCDARLSTEPGPA